MKFSVIIPTYNRSKMLAEAISSVRTQSFDEDSYEIIIVDNASHDDTVETVDRLNQDGGKQILYVYEAIPGLHFARHAGAKIASGDILVYIDDDVLVSTKWLREYSKAYETLNPDCAGGKIIIQWDKTPPEWVVSYEPTLGQLDYGPSLFLLHSPQSINGGNFSIKKKKLFEIGGFNPDQIGSWLFGDGEIGLCRKIHRAGWAMAWVPDAVVWHRQYVDRNATLKDLGRRFQNNGVSSAFAYYQVSECNQRVLIGKALIAGFKALGKKVQGQIVAKHQSSIYNKLELEAYSYWGQFIYYLRLAENSHLRKMVLKTDWINDLV